MKKRTYLTVLGATVPFGWLVSVGLAFSPCSSLRVNGPATRHDASQAPQAKVGIGGSGDVSANDPGALLWQDRYDAGLFEQAFAVATLRDGVFVAGYTTAATGRDFVVRAYHAVTGMLMWQDRVDKGNSEYASGVVTDGKRVFVSGTAFSAATRNDWILRAYDPWTGGLLWERMFDLEGRDDVSDGRTIVTGGGMVFVGGMAQPRKPSPHARRTGTTLCAPLMQ